MVAWLLQLGVCPITWALASGDPGTGAHTLGCLGIQISPYVTPQPHRPAALHACAMAHVPCAIVDAGR